MLLMTGYCHSDKVSQEEECLQRFYRLAALNYPIHQKFVFLKDKREESQVQSQISSAEVWIEWRRNSRPACLQVNNSNLFERLLNKF